MLECGIALKEWAIIIAALEKGTQTVLLRKGGIHEGRSGFHIDHSAFWFYPTYDHQSLEFIRPEFHTDLSPSIEPQLESEALPLPLFATVENISVISKADQMHRLESLHVYTEGFIEKRLAYKPERPLYLCLIRVHKPVPIPAIQVHRRYAGCVSWVPLAESCRCDSISPVLNNEELQLKKQLLLKLEQD